MKIRIKFRKFGVMKFVGHLDLMRYFQKAVRRAGIDICYSEGFSPHQIMSFAAPLGVGLTSDGEYFDIEVHGIKSTEETLAALNDVMVDGVEITGCRILPDSAKTAMSVVAAADYELYVKEGYTPPASAADFSAGIREHFYGADSFLITKQTKKSEKQMDLKRLVYVFEVEERAHTLCFSLMTRTGSTDNLKPESVLEALFGKMGLAYCPEAIQIHRKDIYALKDPGSTDGVLTASDFISLQDMGEQT